MHNSAETELIQGQNSKFHGKSSKIIIKKSLELLPDGEIIMRNSSSPKNVSNYNAYSKKYFRKFYKILKMY